ncbi:MAG: ATP-binding protein [Bryobacteraceae bacterium]
MNLDSAGLTACATHRAGVGRGDDAGNRGGQAEACPSGGGELCWTLMRIVVLVGLPGSGKSTYLERLGVVGLSSDAIRQLLADDATDQTIHDRVFETLRYLLRQRLALARPVTYIDATNLTPQERRPYIGIGAAFGCEVEALYFDAPPDVCCERNAGRARVVPAEALAKMQERLTAPSTEEGFTRITRISHLDRPPSRA